MEIEMFPSEIACRDEKSPDIGEVDIKETISESFNGFKPRNYQVKIFEVAMKRNTISVQETGSGKTMIAVMLIREVAKELRSSGKKLLLVFLAPTVHLVTQQCEVIRSHTDLKVEDYYGAKGIDDWNAKCWEKEINTQEVMVMTPQILLDALRNAFLTLDMVGLLIFDECHRANGNHPYVKIMSEFYQRAKCRPKVFGMTASPVIRKGVSSVADCEDQISDLEGVLDSKIYAVDRSEMEIFVPSAMEIRKFYNPMLFFPEGLKEKMESLLAESLARLGESKLSHFKDKIDAYQNLVKKLSSFHGKILYCLENLGLISAYEATKICLEKTKDLISHEACIFPATSASIYKHFLLQVQHFLQGHLKYEGAEILETEDDVLQALKMGYVSPKLCELLDIIRSFGKSQTLVCMIFVDRIITAKVIDRFIKKLNYFSHLGASHLTGGNSSSDALTPKLQKITLDLFRTGKVNLLFTTDVAEEGIDLHNCSYVIRFDLPSTVRSYVQSRGRARQDDSHYFLMLERGNHKQRDLLFNIIRSEQSMRDTSLNRDPDVFIRKGCWKEGTDTYFVGSTGASITLDSSVSLIYKYCERLPGDKYFTPKPRFKFALIGGSYECTLYLPLNAAFQEIKGPIGRNSHISKQLVCIQACQKLHEMGALDDHLLPITEELSDNNLLQITKESDPGAGTTKRKELHGMSSAYDLSGTWAHKPVGVTLHAYRIEFSCNLIAEQFSGFVLLIETSLDNDVSNSRVALYLTENRVVNSTISSCGQFSLDAVQLKKAKLFQEFFFNALFGKLFSGKDSVSKQRIFLFQDENRSLWSSSNMYMLLPLDSQMSSSHGARFIDWKAIDRCFSAVGYLRCIYLANAEYHSFGNSSGIESMEADNIILADGSIGFHGLKDKIVIAIHTGKIYTVIDVLNDTTAYAPFDNPDYGSFSDYFNKKYKIVLQHPGRPLLHLKQSHKPHNLLSSKSEDEGAVVQSSCGSFDKSTHEAGVSSEKKSVGYVKMPSELLLNLDLSKDVLKSCYLLPSLMHRLESLMLANQLGKQIGLHTGYQIPSHRILEAVTTLRCCEDFSLERLELLGDSVLKYAVSCNLFLAYPAKHEGQLSERRTWAVCNSTLHKLATNCKLQGYIRDAPFDPCLWVVPGQVSRHPRPCSCKVDTVEVPLERQFQRDDTVKIGVACDRGHRWMCSKTLADCVEALIGAYYVEGGLKAACAFMKWLGIDAEIHPTLVAEAQRKASTCCYLPKIDYIEELEQKIGYKFSVRGLLLEATTHATMQELGAGYCYQRLEFLGDSVLDFLITSHLFHIHKDIDPGLLTDLRSASVNNENFAQIAVRHNLQQYLQHGSGFLLEHIAEYVNLLQSNAPSKGPKVLGDIVESIAGALLIDTAFNDREVWRIFKPLISPIVTPDNLHLHPTRELNELCSRSGFFLPRTVYKKDGQLVVAETRLQLKDVELVGMGCTMNKKSATERAASQLLIALRERGIAYSQCISKRKHNSLKTDDVPISMRKIDSDYVVPISKKQKITQSPLSLESSLHPPSLEAYHHPEGHCKELSNPKDTEKSTVYIDMKKGGPRKSLYELCKKMNWLVPEFKSVQEGLRFRSTAVLHIPNSGLIEIDGEQRTDKKSSQDSAALFLLYELGKQGRCIIENC